jgi:hypothetical protein
MINGHPATELPASAGRDRAEGEAKGLAMKDFSERPKEKKTAEELAAMIQEDISKMDGCPKHGVKVTVYGIPWRAALAFGVAAGPVRNRAELQKFFDIITERLQRLYDVASRLHLRPDRRNHPAWQISA